MKVIGKTNGGFILEASDNEIKALLSAGDDKRKDLSKLAIGNELTFTIALQNLNAIKDVRMSDRLYYLKNSLKDATKYIAELNTITESVSNPILLLEQEVKDKAI